MTRTSNPPMTSKVAYHMVDFRIDHHSRILYAMKVLSVPSSGKKIAEKAGMDYHQVMRRLCELERESLVCKDGTSITDTNRPCSLYKLIHISPLLEVKEPEPRGNEVQLSIFWVIIYYFTPDMKYICLNFGEVQKRFSATKIADWLTGHRGGIKDRL